MQYKEAYKKNTKPHLQGGKREMRNNNQGYSSESSSGSNSQIRHHPVRDGPQVIDKNTEETYVDLASEQIAKELREAQAAIRKESMDEIED